jgi:hypothetical protein
MYRLIETKPHLTFVTTNYVRVCRQCNDVSYSLTAAYISHLSVKASVLEEITFISLKCGALYFPVTICRERKVKSRNHISAMGMWNEKAMRAIYIVACRPVAGQRPWDKQIYKSRYWVTPSQTNMFQRKRLNYNNEERFFSTRSVPRCYKRDKFRAGVGEEKIRSLVWDGR